MVCPNCGKKDRHDIERTPADNIPGTDSALGLKSDVEADFIRRLKKVDEKFPDPMKLSYKEYIKEREQYVREKKSIAEEMVSERSEDFKRIQIHDLVMIFNYEEFSPYITPHQAIVALWEFSHSKSFNKIFDEFEGLREQVDLRYKELKDKNITLLWKI